MVCISTIEAMPIVEESPHPPVVKLVAEVPPPAPAASSADRLRRWNLSGPPSRPAFVLVVLRLEQLEIVVELRSLPLVWGGFLLGLSLGSR